MVGFYESLVDIIKRSLRKVKWKKSVLVVNNCFTLLKEAEAIINSGPLVYVGDDINSSMTLTLAHIITLNPKNRTTCHNQDIDLNSDISPTDRLLVT